MFENIRADPSDGLFQSRLSAYGSVTPMRMATTTRIDRNHLSASFSAILPRFEDICTASGMLDPSDRTEENGTQQTDSEAAELDKSLERVIAAYEGA
eukprot:10655916-Ditylum_brightwellii.AAC.1